jgi:hypothetical protein
VVGIGIVAVTGPLRPGWSQRAGTSAAVLAQLNASFQSGSGSSATGAGAAPSGPTTSSTGGVPSPPFSQSVQGTYQTSAPNREGQISVVLTMAVPGSTGTPLVVTLNGSSVNGGVAMSSSQVTWGPDSGTVTALQGSTIGAKVSGPSGSVDLTLQLNLDQSTGTLTGTVSGTAGSSGGGQ